MHFLSENHGVQGWTGEMSERIKAFDWSRTDLGPIEQWGSSLRTAVQFLLASPVPLVMLWGRPGYMIYNDAYSVFAGGRHPYLLGSPVELGWPEVAEFNRNVVDTCLAGGTLSYSSLELVLLRNGQPEDVWMDLYYSPVPGDDGAPAGVMSIVVETTAHVISERRRQEAEDAYRAANERLQMALNTGALRGSFVWDIKANRLSGDERFARTFSYPVDDSRDGLPIEVATEIVHPDDLAAVNEAINRTLQTGQPYNAEYRILLPDGSYLWILASGVCEFDEQGEPLRFPGVLIDINERKLAEEALRKLTRNLEQRVEDEVQARSAAEEKLRQSQKLEAIGGLTGGVAHDFNNVLQIIAGNLHLLASQEPGSPAVKKRVPQALAAVERGAKLSSQLLAFARRQQLSPAVYSLQRIYDGLAELLPRALGETIQVQVQLPDDPWLIHVDRNQLENALLNLALNSRDAMHNGGTLRITGTNLLLDNDFCAGKDLIAGEHVRLSVADNGAGMLPDILDHAFEPFFTTKPDGHGTGLGLSMVFGFVKQSGGHIEITSDPGHGTTVHMYFARNNQVETPETQPVAHEGNGGQERVLVIEDDPQVRDTTVDLLRAAGYQVHVAPNGDAAMNMLMSGIAVDLIFTDVIMPGQVKSTDIALWAKARQPAVPVLFTSGHTRDTLGHHPEIAPDFLLLRKPYGPDTLIAMIKAALNPAPGLTSATGKR